MRKMRRNQLILPREYYADFDIVLTLVYNKKYEKTGRYG